MRIPLELVPMLVACAHTAPRPVDLAFTRSRHGQLIIPVTIGDAKDLPFIVDTGAGGTIISPEIARTLPLRPVAGDATATGAGGVVEGARYLIQDFSVGGRRYHHLEVVAVPFQKVDDTPVVGVLGRDFLGLHAVEIDFPGHKLRLLPASADDAAAKEAWRLPFTDTVDGLIRIEARVDGRSIPAVLDFGAGVSLLNWKAARFVGVAAPDAAAGGARAQAIGADGKPTTVVQRRFGTIGLGSYEVADRTLMVGDLPVFPQLGLGDGPAMLVGLDLFDDRVVVIDYARHQLSWWTPPR